MAQIAKKASLFAAALLFAAPAWPQDACTLLGYAVSNFESLLDEVRRHAGVLTPAEDQATAAALNKYKKEVPAIKATPSACPAALNSVNADRQKLGDIVVARLPNECRTAEKRLTVFAGYFEETRKGALLTPEQQQQIQASIDKFKQEIANPALRTQGACAARDKAIDVERKRMTGLATPPDTVTPAYWSCMAVNAKAQGELAALWDRAIRNGKDAAKTVWWADQSLYLDQLLQNKLYSIGKGGNMQVNPTYLQGCGAISSQIAKMRRYLEAAN